MSKPRTLGVLLLVAMVAMVPVVSAAQPVTLSYSDESDAPNPVIDADVTKDSHDMANMSATDYEDDSGDIASIDGTVNASNEMPVTITATNIAVQDFSEFPRNGESDNTASALDASEWTVDNSGSTGAIAVTDTQNNGVAGVQIATDGNMASGDTATATYNNFSIDSDAQKRYASFAYDIDTLDSGASATVDVVDDDGDIKRFVIDSSADADAENTMATSTGDGYISQDQLGQISTTANGDGTFDSIDKIVVTANDADVDADFTLINAEKKSPYKFGDERVDSDGDGELDSTEAVLEHDGGSYAITGFDSFGDSFDNAIIHDVTVDVIVEASELSGDDVRTETEDASNYPGFDKILSADYRFELADAYDLSWSNAELKDSAELPSERYSVEYAEGTGDTALDDITSFSAVDYGQDVTVDDTIQPGQSLVLSYDVKLTSDELASMTSSGAGGPMASSGDTPFSSIPVIGGIIGVLYAVARRIRG